MVLQCAPIISDLYAKIHFAIGSKTLCYIPQHIYTLIIWTAESGNSSDIFTQI